MTDRDREREDAYEAQLRAAVLKYKLPPRHPGDWERLDQDRGLAEWLAAQPKPCLMKGADLWWEFWELEAHTDREYGSYGWRPVCDRRDALKEEIRLRACADDPRREKEDAAKQAWVEWGEKHGLPVTPELERFVTGLEEYAAAEAKDRPVVVSINDWLRGGR